jgi:nicotinamidase-related amidase
MATALLIIDIQNDYFPNGTMTLVGSERASLKARKVLDRFRVKGLPVVHIQHIAASPAATFFLPQTRGADIHENVLPNENEKVITKHFPNSFRDTALLEYLKNNEVKNLVICGMMTHMCIDATTRAAKDLGFSCVLIGDACATKRLEIMGESVEAKDVHNSFLGALNGFYSTIKTTKEYLEEN